MQNTEYTFDYIKYKKRTLKTSGIPFSILLTIIILLTGFIIYIKPIKLSSQELYFIKANSFSTYQQANSLAQEIQAVGGAGYIHLDKQYHVLINFYKNKSDAESVLNSIKDSYKNSKLYSISIKNFKNVKNFNEKQNKSVKNLANFTISTINNLSSLSIKLDKDEINFNQLSTKITSMCENYIEHYNNFLNQFKTNSKQNISREYAFNIKQDLELLANYNEAELRTNLKYLLIDISINYSSFASSFWFLFLINSTNCQIAKPIKNNANNLVKISFFNLTATSAPPKLNIHPIKANNQVDLKSTSLFFKWMIMAIIDIGKKATKLTPCALNCWYDKNIVKIGIVSVPPPIPMPPIMPPKTPAIISQNIIYTYLNNIPNPPRNIKKTKMPFTALLFNLFNSFAPIIPPPTIPTITGQDCAKLTELLHKYTIVLTKLIGRITNKAVAWAFFCSIPYILFRSGTTTIPPPPPKKPFIIPINAPNKKICQNLTFFIKILWSFFKKLFAFF